MILSYLNKTPSIHDNSFIFKSGMVIGDVTIGRESSIWFGSVLRGDVNSIVIGEGTNIQDNSTIHVTTGKFPTVIGDRVTIGHNVTIHGSTIEDESLIGMGAVVLDGCHISKNTIIAAGTVLRMHSDIPEGVLVAGNPGKIKRDLTLEEIEFFNKSAQNYIKYSYNYLTSSSESIYSKDEIKLILDKMMLI